ncbi:MAG: tetratricopeptide repeat protein [Alphaproteobacteria bacterium]|nr:tetratricopeptide repeat protein [Alphaproteobacteria bacterium]
MTRRRLPFCLLLSAALFGFLMPLQVSALRAESPAVDPAYYASLQALRQTAALRMLDVMKAQLDGDRAKEEAAAVEAIKAYDALIAAVPDDLPAHNARGILKEQLGAGQGAADLEFVVARASVRILADAQDAESYHTRATALRSLKKFAEARADYQEAIRLQPDNRKWGLDLRAMETEAPRE